MTSDDRLPPGQTWGKKFVIYAALGIPRIEADSWTLRVDGMVENPTEYTYQQLTAGENSHYARPFFCVTRWSIRDAEWDGVLIRRLVAPAKPKPEAGWVMFHCADGYTAPVPVEDALGEDAIVALRLNGKALSAEQGFPARPFIPNLYGWKSAKWLSRIEFMRDYRDGYWEMFGYHERAGVWEEERFKGNVGRHSKKTAYGTA